MTAAPAGSVIIGVDPEAAAEHLFGSLPTHWRGKKTKYLFRFVSGGTPPKEELDLWNGIVPWASPKDMKVDVLSETEDTLSMDAVAAGHTSLLPASSLFLVVRSGILKHTIPTAVTTIAMAINQDIKGLVPNRPDVDTRFYAWSIRGYNDVLLTAWRKLGATVESLETELIAQTQLPFPPYREQLAIAAFLDRETARIDGLIAKKRRLIELLREKRQAVISHAVTKGIDPNAPMKDSHIEWLGHIPAHWRLRYLKHISPKVTVGIVVTPARYYVDQGVPALRSLNVQEGQITLDALMYISEESNELHAKSKIYNGDLVAVRTGQPGSTAIVGPQLDGANCIDLIVIRASREISSEYLHLYLNSDAARAQYQLGSEGAIQQHFNVETARNIVVPLPSPDERQRIVELIARQTTKLDHVLATVEVAIQKLNEHRAALIASAVTGKIDVRGFATDAVEAAD